MTVSDIPWWAQRQTVFIALGTVWLPLWIGGFILDLLSYLSLIPACGIMATSLIAGRNSRRKANAIIAWTCSCAMVAMSGGGKLLPRDNLVVFGPTLDQMFDRWWEGDIERHVVDHTTWRSVHFWPHLRLDADVGEGGSRPRLSS